MFTTKIFIKKNKVGNYLKNVREHYIRDDIFCGLQSCKKCRPVESNLSSVHKNKCSIFPYNHYLILDTNVVLDQMDVLEESVIENVIILHTVLKEVKYRSLPIYKRLCSVIDNPDRHFYVFIDDHHKDTYLVQKEGETINDFNDRCIRRACSWYIIHYPERKFVFLTNDNKCLQLALQENIPSANISDYVKNLNNNELTDKLSHVKDYHQNDNQKDIFPNHLTSLELLTRIKEGKLKQGVFKASGYNYLLGFVTVDDNQEPITIQGRTHLNRAVNGDTVALELLDKSEWISPSDEVLEDEGDINEDTINNSKSKTTNVKPTGRIVGIIRRKWRQFCGILQGNNDGLYQLFVPADRNIPKIRIETRQADVLRAQKIIVTIDSWPRNSRYPHGHFVRALGPIGEQNTENEVILLEHDVPHSQFSAEVLACLPELPWTIAEKDLKTRMDLRSLDICSVDPPGCTDIDDALHCRQISDDLFEVGVHIADVSHFIRPESALDREAAARATTVYLVNKRIDMVPELLSSNLCSLRGGEERYAFSCIWEMSKNAEIRTTRFYKSIIKSRRAMTYEEAQMTIDDKTKQDVLAKSLRQLNEFAKVLKKRRLANGALVLASPEVKVLMDSETFEPLDVEVKKMFETNSMVEEFMLLANISVGEKILCDFPQCAMLRRHPIPPASNFDPLVKAARHLGVEIDIETGKGLATSLDNAVKEDNPFLNTMLRILTTRCMLQAVYFASGAYQQNDYFHYGLAVPLYTHFTSPIRRYADIIVHRLLAVSCRSDSTYPNLLDKDKTMELCKNLNYRNRMAQYAGRASITVNTHLFFKGKIQDEEGYVLRVRKNALQILIPRYGLECTLYLSKHGEESTIFQYNEEEQTQCAGSCVIHVFDPVVVRLSLDSNNIQHEKFMLHLVKPYIPNFSVAALNEQETYKRKVETNTSQRKKNKNKA